MSDIRHAFKVMNSLLLEATLKDSFSSIVEDSKIRVILDDGSEKLFVVREVMPGRVKVVDSQTKVLYTFTNDAIKDGQLIMYQYDKNKSNFQGSKLQLDVKEFIVGKDGGDVTYVDVIDPELVKKMDEMNAELKKAKKGSNIYISSEEVRDSGNLANTIILSVYKQDPDLLTCVLEDIDAEKATNTVDRFAKQFRNSNIYIQIDDLVKIKNDSLGLVLKTDTSKIPIQNIIAIEVVGENEEITDKEDSEFSKEELAKKIKSSPEYLEAISKTPSFWDTLFNASPKGVKQIEDILSNTVMSTNYLTPGSYVDFKLVTDSKIVNSEAKLVKNFTVNGAKVEKGNTIVHGTRRRGHWELKLIEELDPTTFVAKIKYCNKSLRCQSQGKGTIKLVKNG